MATRKYVSLNKLSTFLENLKSIFAAITHKHTLSDISDYTVDSSLSPTSTNPVQNKVLDTEFEAVSVAMEALELSIDNHNHDRRYYTEDEINEIVSQKSQVQIVTWEDDD